MRIKKLKRCVAIVIFVFIFFEAISYASYKNNIKKDYNERFRIVSKYESNILNIEEDLTTEERNTINLINKYRNENGLENLKINEDLQAVAKIKAEDIVDNNYFAHDSDELGTPFQMLKNNGIEYSIAGENLAENISPEKAVDAWINSESHRANILEEKYQYTGIYVINSEEYGMIFVQIFVGI